MTREDGHPTDDAWREAYELLDQALDLDLDPDSEELAAWLAELDVADDVRTHLEQLLAAEGDRGLLDLPAFPAEDRAQGMDTDASFEPAGAEGKVLGAWRLDEEIGRGGMSTVYRATRVDASFRQTAAVKVLRTAMLGAESVARFRREQQILASLHHPTITPLLDGGVAADGTPYLVMEEVRGARIDTYCAGRGLAARDIVRLVLQVAEAVAFAHRSLVVHRDLKPANVLVDGSGAARLLDFGVAKLLEPATGESVAGPGASVGEVTTTRVLTPGYGAPEQRAGGRITTATDVYGLGAVLYRLLSGETPWSDERWTLGRVPDRPGDPPQGPSQTPSKRPGAVQGIDRDLDNVVMMALRTEPERRHAGAEALADDLRRWLDGRPVAATPDRLGYRLRKLVRRHRAAAAALVVAVLGLLAGSGVALWQAAEARASEREATRQLQRAEAVTDFLVETFAAADPNVTKGSDLPVAKVLDAGAERIEHELEDEPATRRRLRSVLGSISFVLGDFERAEHLLTANLAEYETALETEPANSGYRAEQLHDLRYAARNASMAGDLDLADQRFRQALDLVDAAERGGAEIEVSDRAQLELFYLSFLIEAQRAEEAIARIDAATSSSWIDEVSPHRLAGLEVSLGAALLQQGRLAEARRIGTSAVARYEQAGPDYATGLAAARSNLSSIVADQGDLEEAAALERQALDVRDRLLGAEHALTLISRANLATILKNLGRFGESAALLEVVLAQQNEQLGADHPHVASMHFNLGQARFLDGEVDLALDDYRRAIAVSEASEHRGPIPGLYRAVYGHALAAAGRADEGERELRRGLAFLEERIGADHPLTARVRVLLAERLADQGRAAEALEETERTVPILESTYGPTSRELALGLLEHGRALAEADRNAAVASLERGLELLEDGPFHLQYADQIRKARAVLDGLGR